MDKENCTTVNREKNLANRLLVFYGLLCVGLLLKPQALPVQAFKTYLAYLVNPAPFYAAHAINRLSDLPVQVAQVLSTDIENRQLREEMKRLEWVSGELEAAKRENDRLRGELGIKPSAGRTLRWAKIIERDPSNWFRNIMVDAGAREGLDLNQPVLGVQNGKLGVVGRVAEVGPRWSKVLLLTDELSAAAGYVPKTQWEGLVEGKGGPLLRMNYLPAEATFELGEPIVTSATSATFPPDILVGTVAKIYQPDPFLTFQSIDLKPAVDPSSLKEVLILSSQ